MSAIYNFTNWVSNTFGVGVERCIHVPDFNQAYLVTDKPIDTDAVSNAFGGRATVTDKGKGWDGYATLIQGDDEGGGFLGTGYDSEGESAGAL